MVIGIARAVDGCHIIITFFESELSDNPRFFLGDVRVVPEGIHHDIPDQVNAPWLFLLLSGYQLQSVSGRTEDPILIGYYPVDLLRHRTIKTPESRLNMGNRNMKFCSSECTSKS